MKHLKYKTFQEFEEKHNFNFENGKILLITDIDGVFFNSIYDPLAFISIIRKKDIQTFEKILAKISVCWIFTNRWKFFRKFPFINQLQKSMQEIKNHEVVIHEGTEIFLGNNSLESTIIIDAEKPSKESQKVVEKGIENFKNVIYVGAHDKPFEFTDLETVKGLERKSDLSKLTFVEIL